MTLGLASTHSFEEDDVNASPVFRYPVLVGGIQSILHFRHSERRPGATSTISAATCAGVIVLGVKVDDMIASLCSYVEELGVKKRIPT